MLNLHCPYCDRTVDETDLHPGGEAHVTRHGPGADAEAFENYLFMRANPKGVHFERWRHVYGCGKWFLAARNTATLEVYGTYSAQTLAPPQSVQEAIKAKVPDWHEGDRT